MVEETSASAAGMGSGCSAWRKVSRTRRLPSPSRPPSITFCGRCGGGSEHRKVGAVERCGDLQGRGALPLGVHEVGPVEEEVELSPHVFLALVVPAPGSQINDRNPGLCSGAFEWAH